VITEGVLILKTKNLAGGFPAGWTEVRSGTQIRRPSLGPRSPRGRVAPPRPGRKIEKLYQQVVVAVSLDDPTLPAGVGNSQLRCAFGTVRKIHDLVTQAVIAHLPAEPRHCLRGTRTPRPLSQLHSMRQSAAVANLLSPGSLFPLRIELEPPLLQ